MQDEFITVHTKFHIHRPLHHATFCTFVQNSLFTRLNVGRVVQCILAKQKEQLEQDFCMDYYIYQDMTRNIGKKNSRLVKNKLLNKNYILFTILKLF